MDNAERDVLMGLIRAEAKAQAKIMAQDVANQFNMIHKGDKDTIDTLARANNTLGVMVEVIIDLLSDPRPLQTEGLAADKRKKFSALCDAKAAAFEKSRAGERG